MQCSGVISTGFGLYALAAAAVARDLVLRDVDQRTMGNRVAVAAMIAGTALSYVVADPAVASASAVAFAVSESLDFVVHTRLALRWACAVLCSGLAGFVLDSAGSR
ncbi:MAG: beta-carotene 15,15-monooxygenase [Amycolatopsis sp.]|nr:beta-carotene 15,15-monooxygenase [Amycolatopsis sp.]